MCFPVGSWRLRVPERAISFSVMNGLRYVYWRDGDFWLGYLEEYPDYMTQGESLEDLQDHLRDLYADLSADLIPAARRVAILELP